MQTKIFDGKSAANIIKRDLKFEAQNKGLKPNLAVVLVGEDPASVAYVGRKQKACEELGFGFHLIRLPSNSTFEKIRDQLSVLNSQLSINGILVQLPLPGNISAGQVISLIKKEKEIDGLSPTSLFISPTAQAVIHVLTSEKANIKGAKAVVLGRGKTAGVPIAKALKKRGAQVFVANSQTHPSLLTSHLLTSDLIISAVGKPNLINGGMIKEGAVVIGVGVSRLPTEALAKAGMSRISTPTPLNSLNPPKPKVVGDIHEQSLMGKASLITPTPSGIGPLTVAFLLKNLLRATESQIHQTP